MRFSQLNDEVSLLCDVNKIIFQRTRSIVRIAYSAYFKILSAYNCNLNSFNVYLYPCDFLIVGMNIKNKSGF